MIIITGSVQVDPDQVAEAEALCIAHCRRSRREPGCLHHAVHRDLEDAHRLVFVEHWSDRDAVDTHFAVPESGAFVTELQAMATAPATIEIYDVTPASR